MKQEIDYLYEPVYSEASKVEFLEVELRFAAKYISFLEKIHNKEKLSIYEQFSLLRLMDWIEKMDKERKDRLIDYVIPLMSYEGGI